MSLEKKSSADMLEFSKEQFDKQISVSPELDLTPLIESRRYLENCIQEVEYLLQASTFEQKESEIEQQIQQMKRKALPEQPKPKPQQQAQAQAPPLPQQQQQSYQVKKRQSTGEPSIKVPVLPSNKQPIMGGYNVSANSNASNSKWKVAYKQLNEGVLSARLSDKSILTMDPSRLDLWPMDGTPNIAIHNGYKEERFTALCKDGDCIYTAFLREGIPHLEKWSLKTLKSPLPQYRLRGQRIYDLGASNGIVACASADGIVIYDDNEGGSFQELAKLPLHDAKFVRLINQNAIIVAYGNSPIIEIHDLKSTSSPLTINIVKEDSELPTNADTVDDSNVFNVQAMTYLRNEGIILTGHSDGVIRAFDVHTGMRIRATNAHDAPITHLAVSPDEAQFVSSANNGQAKIWDTRTLTLVEVLEHSNDEISSIDWNNNNILLVDKSKMYVFAK